MKIKGKSEFHGSQMSVSFSGLKEGRNVRKLRGPREKYCLDYSQQNSHVCGCGYPVARTAWETPPGFEVTEAREIGDPNSDAPEYGKGWIEITIRHTQEAE